MSEGLQLQIGTYQHRLNHLLQDGLELCRNLRAGLDHARHLDTMRVWQRECAATIGQLSGGSKQHWLSRAYSEAFLLGRPGEGRPVVGEAGVDAIVERILGVLREAQASLAEMHANGASSEAGPTPIRFGFVHDPHLRPRLERAFDDARAAGERGEHALALVTWASMLDAMLTDALERTAAGIGSSAARESPITTLTFDARIRAAEEARLISRGCARLPGVARRYRELLGDDGGLRTGVTVTPADAKTTGQVLRLIMRDLAPGR
jgi:hypothetical protein